MLMAVVLLWRPDGLVRERDRWTRRRALRCCSAVLVGAGRRSRCVGEPFYISSSRQDHDHGDLRHEPRPAGRLRRAGELRPRGVLRPRRATRCAFVAPRYAAASLWWSLPAAMLASPRSPRWRSACSCCAPAASTSSWSTLAFAQMTYFFVRRPKWLRRLGRHLSQRQARRAICSAVTPFDLGDPLHFYYLSCSRWWPATYLLLRIDAGARRSAACCRHPRQRAAHARARLRDLPLQARVLRARRRARRAGGLSDAVQDGFVNPELLGWHLSGTC